MKWQDVTAEFVKLADRAGPTVAKLRAKLKSLPPKSSPDYGYCFFHPDTKALWIVMADGDEKEDYDLWKKELGSVPGIGEVTVEAEAGPRGKDDGWIRIKAAYSPTLHAAAQAANFQPGSTNEWFGGPNPLAASLAGGLLGAGAGYGIGMVGEHLGSDYVEPGRLRKTMALLGMAAGAAPGAYWGSINLRVHPKHHGLRALLSDWPFDGRESYTTPVSEAHAAAKAIGAKAPEHYKQALGLSDDNTGFGSFNQVSNPPLINRGEFGAVVWSDPNTPAPIRAATSGLVDAAALSRRSNIITPWDIAKIAVGVGSGYESGMLVGQTLGALAGLKPEHQKTLQQIGTWSGLLTSVVPLAFGHS